MSEESEARADEFIRSRGITIETTGPESVIAPWSVGEGRRPFRTNKWMVTMSVGSRVNEVFQFPFYSLAFPSHLSLLQTIHSDSQIPDTFEEFCDEYDADNDSISAQNEFEEARDFCRRIHQFFTREDIDAMGEFAQ